MYLCLPAYFKYSNLLIPMKTLCFTLPFLLLLTCCKSKQYTASELPPNQLRFGNGGGFSGFVTEYTLLDNGQMFVKKSPADTLAAYKNVKTKQAKALYQQLANLKIETLDFNHPGNMYYYIESQQKDSLYRVTWGSMDQPVRKDVNQLYQNLMELVK